MKPDAPKREDRKEIPLLAGGQGLAPERRFRLKNSRRLMLQFGVTSSHSKLWDSSGPQALFFIAAITGIAAGAISTVRGRG